MWLSLLCIPKAKAHPTIGGSATRQDMKPCYKLARVIKFSLSEGMDFRCFWCFVPLLLLPSLLCFLPSPLMGITGRSEAWFLGVSLALVLESFLVAMRFLPCLWLCGMPCFKGFGEWSSLFRWIDEIYFHLFANIYWQCFSHVLDWLRCQQ